MRRLCIHTAAILFPLGALAQNIPQAAGGTDFDSTRLAQLSFDRVLNTFIWNGSLRYAAQLADSRFSLMQQGRSRLIRSGQESIQDEYQGTIDIFSNIGGYWNLEAAASSNSLSDNRASDLARLERHRFLGGLVYTAPTGVSVTGLGGVEFNAQESERDRGFAYSTRAEVSNLPLQEVSGSLSSSWTGSFLGNRQPEQRNLDLRFHRTFADGTADSLVVQYEKQRREFYVALDPSQQVQYGASANVFRRNEELVDVSNRLSYRVSEQTNLSMEAGLSNRTVDRSLRFQAGPGISDPAIQVSQLHGEIFLRQAFGDAIRTGFGIQRFEREESHTTHFLDNTSQRTAVLGFLTARLGENDWLKFLGSANILRYDTPDPLNVDDRDELLVTLGLEETHVFDRHTTLSLRGDVTLNHLVYMHSTQSANNNWNRVLRFSPVVGYTPSDRVRSTNVAEVLANYTIYDFEEQVAFVQSFSFRQASWFDSTVVQLAPRVQFTFYGGIRIYERGILRWREFKERPENYFVDQSYWPQVFFTGVQGLTVGFGFRYFSQDRYAYSGPDRVRDLSLETSGPTARVSWQGPNGEEVVFDGWSETQKNNGRTVASIPNLTVRVSLGI